MKNISRLFLVAIMMLSLSTMLLPLSLFAQATGTIEGGVKDTEGSLLAGVKITLTNTQTGLLQGSITDATGFYRFAAVTTAGSYSLKAEYTGFKKALATDIVLRSGETRGIDLTLKQYESEEVSVIGERAPLINRTNGEVSSFVTSEQIQTIPTDGRKISNQLYFLPGVSPATGYFPEAPNVSINGQNSLYTNYLIDGFDNNERFLGGQKFDTPIGIAQNVAVLTNSYTAEFGRTANGIVNITTKSGTNDLKGEVFYYSRPGASIDAPNFFSPRDANREIIRNGFNRNQAGISIGGPIVKDQTFFFFNTELTRDNKDNVINSPAVNAVVLNESFSYLFTGKIEHRWSEVNSTSLRANVGIVGFDNNGGGSLMPSGGWVQDRNTALIAAKHNWNISPTTLNETRVQYSFFRWNYGRPKNGDNPQVTVISSVDTNSAVYGTRSTQKDQFGRDSTVVTSATLGTVGHSGFTFDELERTVQVGNTYTQSFGRHTFKAGADAIVANHSLFGGGNKSGNYTVRLRNDADFARRNSPFGLADIPGAVDVLNYTVEVNPDRFGTTQTNLSAFVEDSYKFSDRLTLNAGVRWDFDNLSRGGTANKYDFNNIAPRLSANYLLSSDGKDVLRGGYGIFYEKILYAIASDALQASSRSPAFLAQLQALKDKGLLPADTDINQITFDGNVGALFQGSDAPSTIGGGKTADELRSAIDSLPARELRIANPNGLQNPFSHQLSLGYQRQLSDDVAFSIDGVLLFGENLARLVDVNAPTPYNTTSFAATETPRTIQDADESRPAPVRYFPQVINGTTVLVAEKIGQARQVTMSETRGKSSYQGITMNLKKALTNNYAFNIAYTLSWNRNNTDDINFRAQDANDFEREWAFAVNDRRHVLALTGFYQFSFGTTLSLNALFQSGQPINRTVGFSNNEGDGNFYGHGLQSGDSFAGNLDRFPGVQRNGERLPGYTQFDLGVTHRIPYDRYGLELRAEIFNLFNAVNYSGYFANAGETNRAQLGRAGDPILYRSAGAGTQYQFAARITF